LSLSDLKRKSDTLARVSLSLSDLKRKSDTRSRVSLSLSNLKRKSDTLARVSHSLSDLAIKQENTSVFVSSFASMQVFSAQGVLNEPYHEIIRLKHLKPSRPVYQSYLL